MTMAHQTKKLIFAETKKLEYRYITLNDLWEKREIPDNSIYGENMEFIANMRTMTEKMKKEIKTNYLMCDEKEIVSGILFAIKRNKALYKKKYSGLKVKDSSKLKNGPDLLRNQCLSTAKIIFEHSVKAADFIVRLIKLHSEKDIAEATLVITSEPRQRNLPTNNKFCGSNLLNKNQVALLAFYMRKSNMLHPACSNTLMAECFGKMSGYSNKQLIKKFDSTKCAHDISQNKKDFQSLQTLLADLAETVKSEIDLFSKEKSIK